MAISAIQGTHSPSLRFSLNIILIFLGIFQIAETGDVCYKINPEVSLDEYVTSCYKLAGTALGKAIFERCLQEIRL
jgi:hypothetical protein